MKITSDNVDGAYETSWRDSVPALLVLAGIFLLGVRGVAAEDIPWSEVAKLFGTNYSVGADPTPEQAARLQAKARQFLKTRDANYPALFEKAGREFNVPADVLAGLAFVQTRWVHPDWPTTNVTESFGIMALREGGSLSQAAKALGITPEDLKRDAFQSIRGAAVLLRQSQDATGKSTGGMEEWCAAVVDYFNRWEPPTLCCCAEDWVLKIYKMIDSGYHGEGVLWAGRKVDLDRINPELEVLRARRVLERIRSPDGHRPHPRLVPTTPVSQISQADTTTNP